MGNNFWMDSAFFRDIWSNKTSDTLFPFVIFSILDLGRKNQWSRHLFKKSNPGLFYSKPPRKVSATELEFRPQNLKSRKINRPTCFQTLTFCRNMSFQKSWICLWISKDFPPHGFWIFGEAAGAADKNQDWTFPAKDQSDWGTC